MIRRQRVFKPILFLIIIFVLIVTFELFFRLRFSYDMKCIHDPNHKLSPQTDETNSDGIRCSREPETFQPGDLNFIFLGDSFVYGYEEYPHLALPQQFERIMRERNEDLTTNVANFGWTSSSPVLSQYLLRDIGKHYNPDYVFLFIDMTDFHDDLKYQYMLRRPWNLRIFPGFTTVLSKCLKRWSRNSDRIERLYVSIFGFPPQRFFVAGRPLEQSRSYCSMLIDTMDAIANFTTEQLNAHFFVILLPRSFQYSNRECPLNWEKDEYEILGEYCLEPFRLMEEVRRTRTYPIYSLLPAFQSTEVFPTCRYSDPHWTENGTLVAARAIYDIIVKDKLLVSQ